MKVSEKKLIKLILQRYKKAKYYSLKMIREHDKLINWLFKG